MVMEPVKNKVSDGWRPVFTSKDNDHVMFTLIVLVDSYSGDNGVS